MRPPPIVRRGHPPTLGWGCLVVLLLVVKLGQGEEEISEIDCWGLDSNSTNESWINCVEKDFRLAPNGSEYPIMDISHFKQEDFDKFIRVKGRSVEEEKKKENEKRRFAGNLFCSNSALERMYNLVIFVADANISQSVVLTNNPSLTTVEIDPIVQKSRKVKTNVPKVFFDISGNRRLSESSLKALALINFKENGSYIQDFGECVLSGTIGSFEHLENCHYIKGDLRIDNTTDTSGSFPNSLSSIRGCLYITDTKLKDITFLDVIKNTACEKPNEIRGNKDLCLHPQTIFDIKNKFKDMNEKNEIEIKDNKKCKGVCSWTYLHEEKDENCLIVYGTVTLTSLSESANLTYLSQVEEIHGRLQITHTKLSKIAMFPKLHTIKCNETNPALLISENKKLTSFDFPALTKIIMKERVRAFKMEGNNEAFYVDDDQYEKWKNLTGGEDRLQLPRKAPPPAVEITYSNSTTDEKKVPKTEEDNSVVIGVTVGLVVGVLTLILFAGIVSLAVVKILSYIKKKKKERAQARINERLRHADVADWSSYDTSSINSLRVANEFKGATVSSCSGDNTVRESAGSLALDEEQKAYNMLVADEFTIANQRLNYECTKAAVQNMLKIKRDHLEPDDFKEMEAVLANSGKPAMFFTHNMEYRLYTIRPRQENTKEAIYDIKDPEKFDPLPFIKACMESSNVSLSATAIIGALDYAINANTFGNPDNQFNKPEALINVDTPVHIVGDTHGSLMDLQAILSLDPENHYEKGIHPMMKQRFLFTGDYLDRGIYDYVCFTFLVVLATKFSGRFYLLRGNHEYMKYPFEKAFQYHVQADYRKETSLKIIEKIRTVCSMLPFAAIVDNKIFACHGGISSTFNDKIIEHKKVYDKADVRKLFEDMPNPLDCDDLISRKVRRKDREIVALEKKLEDLKKGNVAKNEPEKKREAAGTDAVDVKQNGTATPGKAVVAPPLTAEQLEKEIEEWKEARKSLTQFQSFARLLTWSDPSPVSFTGNNRGAGHYFNEEDVKTFLELSNLQLIVRGHESVGFHHCFGERLFSLFGQFENTSNEIGFPYVFSNEGEFNKTIENVPMTNSLGILRCENNGSLTMLMLRHAYLDEDRKVEKGPPEKPKKYNLEGDIETDYASPVVNKEEEPKEKKATNNETAIRSKGSGASAKKGTEVNKENKVQQNKSQTKPGQTSKKSQMSAPNQTKNGEKTNKSAMAGTNSKSGKVGSDVNSKQENASKKNPAAAPKSSPSASKSNGIPKISQKSLNMSDPTPKA